MDLEEELINKNHSTKNIFSPFNSGNEDTQLTCTQIEIAIY